MLKNAIALIVLAAGCGAALAFTPPLNTNRGKVLEFFAENVYGVRPDLSGFKKDCQAVESGAVIPGARCRRDITLNVMTPLGERRFGTVLFVPNGVTNKAPCFLYISFSRPDEMLASNPPERVQAYRWPVRDILSRGYATAAFYYRDVFPDKDDADVAKFVNCTARPANGWGAISAWALAASRVMDYLETADGIDGTKVAVVGHSRLGKTSLWAGATDTRFAYVAINDSGCMGARLSTYAVANPVSETINVISGAFPHWFAPKFRSQYAGKDTSLDFDQHWLIATLAPRMVVVSSAEDDNWACPSGEHAGLDLARPAWGGNKGRCHYHIRPGGHDINILDWTDFMDFADKSGWKK